jgi:hypothetical protein
MSASFILLDIGGTDIKTATVRVGSTSLENLYRTSFPALSSVIPIIKEVEPETLINSVRDTLNIELDAGRKVVGILTSGQMACWLITDKNYKNISKVVSWQDLRSTEEGPLKFNDELKRLNGGECRAGLPGLGASHFLKRYSGSRTGLNFETMCSWITRSICSEGTPGKSHITDSAATGLFDIFSRKWRPDLLDDALCELNFPEVHESIAIVGFFGKTRIPVYVPVGDQQASLLGANINSSRIVVNIGTGGQVAAIVTKPEDMCNQVRPFFDGQYISTRTHLPAGRFLASLIFFLQEKLLIQVNYEILSSWKFKEEVTIPVGRLKPESCEEILLEIQENGYSIESAVSIILKSIAVSYLEAIKEIITPQQTEVMFAGGVGQKFKNIQDFICEELSLVGLVAPSEETTLQGLAYLTKQL